MSDLLTPLEPPARSAELVLVSPSGDLMGRLPAVPVRTPWWPEASPVVDAVRARYGIDVVVLRLLTADRPSPPGGRVTYLAETAERPADAVAWDGTLDDHPLRMPWARPGGPAADLRWADGHLAAMGRPRTGPAEQIRTWNLSSLWRLPVADGEVWLKHVPPFFAHEPAMIERLAAWPVPRLIAGEGGRSLMEAIPGEDLHDAGIDVIAPAISLLVSLQTAWLGRTDELLELGLPDWRAEALTAAIADVVDRTAEEIRADDLVTLRDFVDDLPRRFAEIASCGIPNSLVHGDFAPGNLRADADGRSLVLLDWGDSGVGHPLLDQPAMLDRAPSGAGPVLQASWVDQWQAAIPGCEPDRAARLLRPVGAARQATIYRTFLDNIEPSEHPYHRSDPADWFGRAAAIVRAEAS